MNDQIYDDYALERLVKEQFGVATEVDSVIARRIPVGRSAEATLFLTKKKQLFFYIHGEVKLLYSDVQKIISRVGLVAELYMPPKNRPHYFDEVGTKKFQEVFPGRKVVTTDDISFYRTMAPYSPALVLIQEVKAGTIYQYDSDSKTGWRPYSKFSYRRIRTS
jgi:hypothetical protein